MIATSRTPDSRISPAARRPRAGAHNLPGSAPRAVADGRRLRGLLVGLGLAALMGLTTWAVASVSIWLVPAYLVLMVLIFASPRAKRVSSPAPGSRAGPSGADVAEADQGAGADRAAETGEPRPAVESGPGIPAGEAAEAPMTRPDPADAATAKPRRSRARPRKAARTAAEPVSDLPSVTWIRVGPGKFVRADANIQDLAQAQAEEVVAESHPATDAPEATAPVSEAAPNASPVTDALEAVAPASPPPAPFELPAEPVPYDPPGPTPDGEGVVPSTGEETLEPAAEEYGIAPSAFGAAISGPPSAQSLEPGVSIQPVPPMAEPGRIADLGGHPPSSEASPARPGSRRQRSGVRTAFPPGIAGGFRRSASNVVSSRRYVRTCLEPRAALRCSSATDLRLGQAARRASGRTDHVQRAWRPRSPPRH